MKQMQILSEEFKAGYFTARIMLFLFYNIVDDHQMKELINILDFIDENKENVFFGIIIFFFMIQLT